MARKTKEVNEDKIRSLIKGDITLENVTDVITPSIEESPLVPPPEYDPAPEAFEQSEPVARPVDGTARPRRRREPTDYSSAFLRKREASPKRQTYIGAAHFAKITEILAVLSPEVSVPAFLDNLIEHHLEQHRDEINSLYADKFKKPL